MQNPLRNPRRKAKSVKYYIIETDQSSDLVRYVEQLIAERWEPQGGVSVSVVRYVGCDGEHATVETWAQAMVKK